MDLPPNVDYVKEANLFVWRPRGELNEALVNNCSFRPGAGGHVRRAV
jgi:hypothetical protein